MGGRDGAGSDGGLVGGFEGSAGGESGCWTLGFGGRFGGFDCLVGL